MEVFVNTKTFFRRDNFFVRTYYRVRSWLRYTWNKNHITLMKTAYGGRPWDYMYLWDVEYAKIKEMADYLEKSDSFVGVEYVVRDMRICLSLIEIFSGKRDLFHFDGGLFFQEIDKNSEDYDGGNTKRIVASPDFKYNCHVNVNLKNISRFVPNEKVREWYIKTPHELYEQKARYLYHKIRYEHEQEWGD